MRTSREESRQESMQTRQKLNGQVCLEKFFDDDISSLDVDSVNGRHHYQLVFRKPERDTMSCSSFGTLSSVF